MAQAPASCLVVISAVGCFVTCPRKGELWGPWGRPEFLWLGSHRFTLLPEPTGSEMGLDEKQGLWHRSWQPQRPPPASLPATACKEGQGLLGALGTIVYSLNTCRTPGGMKHQVQT